MRHQRSFLLLGPRWKQVASCAGIGFLAGALGIAVVSGSRTAQTGMAPPVCRDSVAAPSANQSPARVRPPAVLHTVADVPLPGPPVRFDYQSLDDRQGRLYIAHMGAGQVTVVETGARRVLGVIRGLPGVTGVWAVPELNRVYASATGLHQVAVIDARTLGVVTRVGRIGFPDGIAYVPDAGKVFVSDEAQGRELVIDAAEGRATGTIQVGGEAGNTVYDAGSGCVLVAVQTRNQVVVIDPRTERVVGRYPVAGADHPHGLAVDPSRRLLFVASENNATLSVMNLRTMHVTGHHRVGDDPDVLAFDPGWRRLYVAAEDGHVTILDETGDSLASVGAFRIPNAHTVAVSPSTHLVYLPLQDVDGHPVLRIMRALPAGGAD